MTTPNFDFEQQLWKRGLKVVGGCDEVGRGCFAGPVVASAVVFSPDIQHKISGISVRINDSKKMTAFQREEADKWIRENALSFGIGEASVLQINDMGIKKATELAMRIAFMNCSASDRISSKIEHLLIDAFYLPEIPELTEADQTPIIKGDSLSFSIAAGSIIAKVYRDNLMNKIGKSTKFKVYEWERNKGYGTKKHREAILEYGTTKHHRIQFVSTYLSRLTTNY